MLLYRLGQQPHIASTAGLGGLYSDGRWHEVGTPILYISEHLSLAKLEVLANAAPLPRNYFLLTLEIADHASTQYLKVADLPLGWDALPYRRETAQLAQSWIQAGTHWLLRVPFIHPSILPTNTVTCLTRCIPTTRNFASYRQSHTRLMHGWNNSSQKRPPLLMQGRRFHLQAAA